MALDIEEYSRIYLLDLFKQTKNAIYNDRDSNWPHEAGLYCELRIGKYNNFNKEDPKIFPGFYPPILDSLEQPNDTLLRQNSVVACVNNRGLCFNICRNILLVPHAPSLAHVKKVYHANFCVNRINGRGASLAQKF